MSHGFLEVTLQITHDTQHEIILHGFQEVMSERQVILHNQAVTSKVLMVRLFKYKATF